MDVRFWGDLTADRPWDAGTELNQVPGVGADQAPRQTAPDMGSADHGLVGFVKDGFSYPPTASVLRVSIRPTE